MEPTYIFMNDAGRLRSGWRLLVFAILMYYGYKLSLSLVVWAGTTTLGPAAESFFKGPWGFILQGLIFLVPATLVGWACSKFLEDLPPRALGWALHTGWFKHFLLGSLIGAASVGLGTALAAVAGGYRFAINETLSWSTVGNTVAGSIPIFLLGAAGEEAIFRGYPLQTMARARLAWVAIFFASVVFSWGHLDNPNADPVFTFTNTALAGVWLSVGYLKTRNLWFPLGLHWAWNWMMGAVLGLPVSGIARLTPEPFLRATDHGPRWLTGGAYGLEGGLACTIALLFSILLICLLRYVTPDPRMLELTTNENPKELNDIPPLQVRRDGQSS